MSDKKIVKLFLNEKSLVAKKIDIKIVLSELRKLLSEKFPKDAYFTMEDGTEIEKCDENDFKVEDILKGTCIYLKSKSIEKKDSKPIEKASEKANEKPVEKKFEKPAEETPEYTKKESSKSLEGSGNSYNPGMAAPLSKQPVHDKPEFGSQLIEKINGLEIYKYPYIRFSEREKDEAIIFMVVGETGCGKTTLLNSFVNVLLGVKYEYKFRYKIIHETFGTSQSKSQTQDVTEYNIRSVDGFPPVTIIDTPGYGDTGGIKRDKEITEKVNKFFKTKVDSINAVCFVAKSSNQRLTPNQKYIFSSIFDLFGEDVMAHFVAMLTFCDGGEPNVVEALKDKDCLFSTIIPHLDKDWYYKFNNSSFYAKNVTNDPFTEMFWKLGVKNFKDLMKKLRDLPRKNLAQSKQVLNERKILEEKVEILARKLKEGLNKIEGIKQEIKIIKSIKGDINDSKNFTTKVRVPKTRQVPLDNGLYHTTCLNCTKTCHEDCYIKDDDNKKNCACIENGHCIVCPGKCFWSDHKNRPYVLEEYYEEETRTLNELKNKYNESQSKLVTKEQILESMKNEILKINVECIQTQDKMMESINLLRRIALNKSVFESAEEHIDLLIETEKSEHKPGWQNRIDGLQHLKAQKKLMREVYQGKSQDLLMIQDFCNNYLQEEIYIKFEENCCIF